MSWIHKLYETYENVEKISGDVGQTNILMPIAHTTQNTHIKITISGEGDFLDAQVLVGSAGKSTIIPCTEESAGRSGVAPVNQPLCDKLQYIAKDFVEYGGQVTSGFAKKPEVPYEAYVKTLTEWCESDFSHPKIKAILAYVEKGEVIKDLVSNKVLFVDSQDKLLGKWTLSGEKPPVFGAVDKGEPQDAVVCWQVEVAGDPEVEIGKDKSIFEKWTNFEQNKCNKRKIGLCYVTGKMSSMAEQHPKKIRSEADQAKIISANDNRGLLFRGRYTDDEQVCGASFEASQKAHNILRWLIARQGYKKDDLVIVAWSTKGKEIPNPFDDSDDFLGTEDEDCSLVYTAQDFSIKLRNKIKGYKEILGKTDDIVVLALDSMTQGRISIIFYCELSGSEFLAKLEQWHTNCSWVHDYKFENNSISGTPQKRKSIRFEGAPTPHDIFDAAYGKTASEKFRKASIMRIVPCIINGANFPADILSSLVRRASNRIILDCWEWQKVLSITCAVYRYYHIKEVFTVALDEKRTSRDYLYGRLLALGDNLEEWAIHANGEKRATNATRLMQKFSERPYSTWLLLEKALIPYKIRLGNKANDLKNDISKVVSMFLPEDFISDKKLSGEFLLGYHSQRQSILEKIILLKAEKKEGEAKNEHIES